MASDLSTATAPMPVPPSEPAARPPADKRSAPPPADCAGPLAIPADLPDRLHRLAVAAGTDDFAALSVGAAVAAQRLSRLGSTRRVRMIQGHRETIAPVLPDLGVGFRAALAGTGEPRSAPTATGIPDPRVDATIVVSQDGTRLYAESMIDSADAPSAPCWAWTFVQLLTGLARDPETPMAAHPLVDNAERERILHGLNRYRRPDIRNRTLAEPFEEQAQRTPDAVALLDESGTAVSYRELNLRANRMAHFLIGQGAGPGTRVGICLRRGIDQVVAIYAVVKTGAAYVPVDTELPDARLAYILDDATPAHILTDAACRNRVPDGPWQFVDVGHGREDCPDTDPTVAASPAGLLHILYTSGTTGHPKGVAYPTAGALANLAWMQGQYPFEPDDCALFKTSAGFDVSIWEIFWPLYHGASLVICRDGRDRDPRHLARLVERHPVSIVFLPPTMMSPFLEHVSAERARLRWALCGGEPVTPRIRDTFYATLPGTTLLNCYGPTEANSVTDMPLPDEPGAPVPLGRPAANFRVMILDEDLELAPVGMPGEAYIGGEIGVAQAYWRAPGRTAERFVPDPYGPPGSRMYRTGDLCRYRPDGVLEHLGRVDRQVKVRGMRIEPGEIESVLATHPAVADCAVVTHGTPTRLLAFVVPVSPAVVDDVDLVAIEEFAAGFLPDHMRPAQIVPVPRIPANVNGKIDDQALIESWQDRDVPEHGVVPPADDVEAAVVAIYRRVLAAESVSVADTFVQLGGNSMLAFELLDECSKVLHVELEAAQVLSGSVREVAAEVRRVVHGRPDRDPAATRDDSGARTPGWERSPSRRPRPGRRGTGSAGPAPGRARSGAR